MKELSKQSELSKSRPVLCGPISRIGRGRGRKKIAIVGVGLIGGSLAIQLHEKKLSSKLIGVDANPEHAQKAVELELVDETLPLDDAIAASRSNYPGNTG